ncbi:MAG: hypothetical protein GX315_05195, partial [Spirochaetales bacterium]|nr:hypothetical protein [Spirochaetales bacterium]
MRHVRLFTLGALICALTVLPFVGCSMESQEIPEEEHNSLTAYQRIRFDDLITLDELEINDDDVDAVIENDPYYDLAALMHFIQYGTTYAISSIVDDASRSVQAQLSLNLDDEIFEVDELEATEDEDGHPAIYTTIDYCDLHLSGETNSLSQLLSTYPSELDAILQTSGLEIGLSAKSSTVLSDATKQTEIADSTYLSLSFTVTEEEPSRTDSGFTLPMSGILDLSLQYSAVCSNFLYFSEVEETTITEVPVLIDIYLKPIRNLNLGVLVSDLSEQYDFENFNWPETQSELY